MFKFIYSLSLPVLVFVVFLLLLGYSHLNSFLKKRYNSNIFNALFCLVFTVVLIYRTVLSRTIVISEIELRPFYSFVLAQKLPELYRSFFMNSLFFVPLGLSMPYCLSKKTRKWPVFVTIIFAAVLSASIEFCQYHYHLGRCETDDVIANTLGAAIGTLSYCLYINILKNQEKESLMQNIDNNQKLLLQLCAKSLFNNDKSIPDKIDSKVLIEESKRQTVFTCIYSFVKDKCDSADGKMFSQIIAKNIRVEYAHNEIHRLFIDNNIPYVILKGVSSASYYPEPLLRTMGDVDVLVAPGNIAKADKLLKSIGFVTTDDINTDDTHIGYKRKDGVACELHRRVAGIPQNQTKEKTQKFLCDIFEKSVEQKISNGSCVVPSNFHHGIILLLHTAAHLTHEGVGLRHLCDWAVFVNSFTNDDFTVLFEKSLKEMGLWRFAQLLTLCCVKHLDCEKKEWAGQVDDDLIDGIVSDILNGGNFGNKDADRYNQIKYIFDRKDGTTAKKNPILQLLDSINEKSKIEFKFVNKSKLFLPIGWLFTVVRYIYMVIVGKRTLDSVSTVTEAKKRKDIYNEFKLYENDQT